MKYKYLMPIVLSIVIGLFFGKTFFDIYDSTSLTVFDEKDKIYMLKIGSYSTKKEMSRAFKNYKGYLYIENNNAYDLYVAITKNSQIADRVKELYKKNGYSIYIEEKIENNDTFLSILSEYDKIIDIASDEDIKAIEKIVISNYKEMVLNDET